MKPTALHNYAAELVMSSDLSLTQTSVSKTNTRYTAKHLIKGAVNNIILISNAHFVKVDKEDIDVRNQLREATPETRELYDIKTDSCGGVPIVPIWSELSTSMDDSTVFIFCGSSPNTDESVWLLTSPD